MMRKLLFPVALATLTLGLALAGPANNSLIVGSAQEPPNIMDSWTSNQLIAGEINEYMRARLVYLDDAGKSIAEIAERVPTLANGDYKVVKDAKGDVIRNSVTFNIRKEAVWSDGTPITTKDFAFWLRVMKDNRVPSTTKNPWSDAKITSADSSTFTITYEPPYLFADKVYPDLAPAHIMEKAFNDFDQATAKLDMAKDNQRIGDAWRAFLGKFTSSKSFTKVVSGPFVPDRWRPGNQLIMTRNPKYWRTPPGGADKYVQTVTYLFIPNTNTLQINVISGKVDALSSVSLSVDQAIDLERSQRSKFKMYYVFSGFFEQISVAQQGERAKGLGLNDKRVRQALLSAIDRPTITKVLYKNKVQPINTWVNPYSPLHKKDTKGFPYDPEKAKALMAAAGWKPGPDGILAKDGKKMVLNFSTTAGNKVRERLQLILKDQWRKIGVDVNIQNYPSSVVFGNDFAKHSDDGRWDLFLFANGSDARLEYGRMFAGPEIPTAANGFNGSNWTKYSSPAYDTPWKASIVEFDGAARAKLYDSMQATFAEDVPSLLLYSLVIPYTKANGLHNFTFTGNTRIPSWNAYQIGWASKGAVEDK